MAKIAYSSLFKNDNIRDNLQNVKSNDESKALLFIDYIYDKLNDGRKSKVNIASVNLYEALKNTSLLYLLAQCVPKLNNSNNEINESLKLLENHKDINIEDIKRWKNINNDKFPLINHYKIDNEVTSLINTRDNLLGKYQETIQERKYKKIQNLENLLTNFIKEVNLINSKEYLIDNDANKVGEMVGEIYRGVNFCKEAEVNFVERKKDLALFFNTTDKIINNYREYNDKIKSLIKENNEEIKRANENIESLIKSNSLYNCNNIINSINERTQNINGFSQNPFCGKEVIENKYKYNELLKYTSELVDNSINNSNINIANLENKLNETKGFFGFFKKIRFRDNLKVEKDKKTKLENFRTNTKLN